MKKFFIVLRHTKIKNFKDVRINDFLYDPLWVYVCLWTCDSKKRGTLSLQLYKIYPLLTLDRKH